MKTSSGGKPHSTILPSTISASIWKSAGRNLSRMAVWTSGRLQSPEKVRLRPKSQSLKRRSSIGTFHLLRSKRTKVLTFQVKKYWAWILSALLKASSIKAGSYGLRPSGVPGSFTSPARTGVWLPLRKMRRSERRLLPVPYCSILAWVNGQSGREANNASAQDLTSAQKATSFSRTSLDLLMPLGPIVASGCVNHQRSSRATPG